MQLSKIQIFCLCAGILYGVPAPAFSADSKDIATVAVDISTSASLDMAQEVSLQPEVLLATATINSEEAINDPETSTEAAEIQEESTVDEPAQEIASDTIIDPFAAEPFAKTSLMRMKKRLQSLSETYFAMKETSDIALATVAASSDSRFFRRTGEFSIRLSRHLPFSALASTLVFPEFIGVANELMISTTRTIIDSSIEMGAEPQKQASLLEKLAKMSELTRKIAISQRMVQTTLGELVKKLAELNNQRFIPAPPGHFFKSSNSHIHQLIEKYLTHWNGLLNQFDHHQNFFLSQLQYLTDSGPALPTVRQAAHLNQMMRSLLDFKVSLEKYYGHLSGCPARVSAWQKALQSDIDTYTASSNSFKAKVKWFAGKFPARDLEDREVPAFSADREILSIFAQLEALTSLALPSDSETGTTLSEKTVGGSDAPAEKSLLDLIRPYLNGDPWIEPEPEPQPEPEFEPELKTDEKDTLASETAYENGPDLENEAFLSSETDSENEHNVKSEQKLPAEEPKDDSGDQPATTY